jgi:TolA-binding protein
MHLGDLIPLTAVILIFGGGLIKRFLDIMERRMEQRISSQDRNVASEIAAMRQELAQLRDTSTQFDMSIERRLDDMDRRLNSVETAGHSDRRSVSAQAASPAPTESPQQTVGLPQP